MNEPKRKVITRVALSKKEFESQAALELVALCETITADGFVSNDEIEALRQWLSENSSSEIPAIGFLVTTVETILSDGKVTGQERRELHRAVERVLPAEARQRSRLMRTDAEQKAREDKQQEKEAEKEAQRQAREREASNRPTHSLDLMVVGTRYSGRSKVISEFCRVGGRIYLVREPDNPYDPNAVRVLCVNGMQIGYVPREHASYLSKILDAGCRQRIEVAKILSGQHSKIPVICGGLYRTGSGVSGSYTEADAPIPPEWAEAVFASGDTRKQDEDTPPEKPGAHPVLSGCLATVLFLMVALLWCGRG